MFHEVNIYTPLYILSAPLRNAHVVRSYPFNIEENQTKSFLMMPWEFGKRRSGVVVAAFICHVPPQTRPGQKNVNIFSCDMSPPNHQVSISIPHETDDLTALSTERR